ncbi:MAG: PAS domain S-box protein, partial [Desulfobacteraceae bacterium]|nr:PAS domain S-box protein [Desulfobacteraceae bacterium]
MTKLKESILEAVFSGEQILQGMPELAYVFDKEGRMLMWNNNVELVLGYSKDELDHKFVGEFIAEADREATIEI